RIPATEPMTKASTDSTSVIHRCFQIVPSTNHLTMRAATSDGLEKNNGGKSSTPPIGTVVKNCQSSTAASATRSWRARSLNRDTAKLGFATSWPCLARPSTSLFETLGHGRNSSGHDGQRSLRLRERSDDAGRALGVPVQRLHELVARQAGLKRIRVEVGGNQGEGVVVRRARGRAGAEVMRQPHQALAADIFLSLLGDLALRKPGHGDWNAVGDPMAHAAWRPAFRIEH